MSRAAPLVISVSVTAALKQLQAMAIRDPIDMPAMVKQIETADGKHQHRKQMGDQTVVIPGLWNFLVTFAIETGHPAGTCRHMSMSIDREGRVPSPEAVWLVAEILGFTGGLAKCACWPEALEGHGQAINLVQPILSAPEQQRQRA